MTNQVSSPGKMGVGDIYQLLVEKDHHGVIDFGEVDPDAEFLLSVLNLHATGASGTVQLAGNLAAPSTGKTVTPVLEEGAVSDPADLFHGELREIEAQMAEQPFEMLPNVGKGASQAPVPQHGAVETFRVIAGLSATGDFVERDGVLSCITDRLLWYRDQEILTTSPTAMSEAELDHLCRGFDASIAELVDLVGVSSDVNGDGRVTVFETPQVNRLGATGGGMVTGFFLASDLYPRGPGNPSSNAREIIYTLTPDPSGIYGLRISRELALHNLLPAVLPHELFHAILFHQHVLLRGGASEEDWLNEGLAHLTEDLVRVGIENPSRYDLYLRRTSVHPIVTSHSPGLAERGGIFLFLRYLFEQHPERAEFLRTLVQTDLTGVENLEQAYGSLDEGFDQFAEFFLRWSATLGLNDQGLTLDPSFRYQERVWDQLAGEFSGVCTICNAADGRNTLLGGVAPMPFGAETALSLRPATQAYYRVSAAHRQITLATKDPSGHYGAVLMRTR